MKNIAILGSTGSIGTQTLDVVRNLRQHKIIGLAANSNIDLLEKQIREFKPKIAAVFDKDKAKELKQKIVDIDTKVLAGMDGLIEVSKINECELLVVCISGMIALIPSLEAIKNKISIALATKEVLVAAGQLVMETAKYYGVEVIPIDSEHCAIKQCLKSNYKDIVNKLVITGSGGPFRGKTKKELQNATISQALNHPNWHMGKKISIDSATLMNKGLEVIEARWLFDITPDKIDVVIHPQSIVHSMVEYIDGSIIAQLGITDMKIPIQYALTYPKTFGSQIPKLNIINQNFTFEKPDYENFGLLKLSYDAIFKGGTMPVVLNSANEEAVGLFLENKISFLEIYSLIKDCMENHVVIKDPALDEILQCEKWARIKIKDLAR